MIGGLRHIFTGESRNTKNCFWGSRHPNSIKIFEKNHDNFYHNGVEYPVTICFQNMTNFIDFQKETIDLISDKFNVISENEINDDDIVIFNYGENLVYNNNYVDEKTFLFLISLFKNKKSKSGKYKNKSFFISRKNSHLLDGNRIDGSTKKRQISNEDELGWFLKNNYDIETIELEKIPVEEKIELFNESNLIISPTSASLTFSIFSSEKTKIIEISPIDIKHNHDQFFWQSKSLGIPYFKFNTERIDEMDNMFVDLKKIKEFIDNII